MIRRLTFSLILITGLVIAAMSQVVSPGNELQEILRIAESYKDAGYLSFDVKYQRQDTLGNLDSVITYGKYKIHDSRFWGKIDSTEFMQGNNYTIAVYPTDSAISVGPPMGTSSSILKAEVLDSLFQANFVDSIQVTNVNDSTRKFNVEFKEGSQFKCYEIYYSPINYLIRSMRVKTQTSEDLDSINDIVITFYNYSTATIDDDYFRESKYILKDGTTFHLQTPYQGFELSVSAEF